MRLFIFLFLALFISTVNAYALFPQRTIVGVDGSEMTVQPDGDISVSVKPRSTASAGSVVVATGGTAVQFTTTSTAVIGIDSVYKEGR